ncbi:MAG: hypothetical protein VB858_16675 [Planctomycetaceae bacterium]
MSEGNYESYSQTPERSGMGCGMKIAIAAGVSMVLMILAVCGGGALLVNKAKDSITDDPVKIRKLRESIVQAEIPEGMEPVLGMDMKIMGKGMSMAAFIDKEHDGAMWFVSLSTPYDSNVKIDDAVRQVQQDQQRNSPQQKMIPLAALEDREDIEKEINGQTGKFVVGRGKDDQGVEHVQVTGIFATESQEIGVVNLIIPAEHMDLAAGSRLIESMQ